MFWIVPGDSYRTPTDGLVIDQFLVLQFAMLWIVLSVGQSFRFITVAAAANLIATNLQTFLVATSLSYALPVYFDFLVVTLSTVY